MGGKPLNNEYVMTTGQVAKVFRVASRTIMKWFDGGQFPNGYLLIDSNDRRIPIGDVIAFSARNAMPLPRDWYYLHRLAIVDPPNGPVACQWGQVVVTSMNLIEAAIASQCPRTLTKFVVYPSVGTGHAMSLAAAVPEHQPAPLVLVSDEFQVPERAPLRIEFKRVSEFNLESSVPDLAKQTWEYTSDKLVRVAEGLSLVRERARNRAKKPEPNPLPDVLSRAMKSP